MVTTVRILYGLCHNHHCYFWDLTQWLDSRHVHACCVCVCVCDISESIFLLNTQLSLFFLKLSLMILFESSFSYRADHSVFKRDY